MNGYSYVSYDCFGACCSNEDISFIICEGVLNVVEISGLIFIFDFKVRNCCCATWTPVDDIFSAIYESFLVEPHKNSTYCPRESFIKCESLAPPIARISEPFHLLYDS